MTYLISYLRGGTWKKHIRSLELKTKSPTSTFPTTTNMASNDEENSLQFVIHRFYKQIEGIDVRTAGLAETREVLHLLGHDGSVLFLHTTTATRGPTLRNKVERYNTVENVGVSREKATKFCGDYKTEESLYLLTEKWK